MLTQTAGEYVQKLQEKDLVLFTSQPEQPIKIMADGRRLWRVFDNLMNNVCKYAQRSTRVYLTLEEKTERQSSPLRISPANPSTCLLTSCWSASFRATTPERAKATVWACLLQRA